MTKFKAMIDAESASSLIEQGDVVVVDCRFYLEDEDAGRIAYELGHIPTAQYVHLNKDLSDLTVAGGGRHPLPSEQDMVELFGRLGIYEGKQVIVYDDANGAAAARFWWMLRYLGHDQVAVLDGGFPAWKAAGLSVVSGIEHNKPEQFTARPRPEMLITMQEIDQTKLLIDSRASERYRGEYEPIDPVAGHIPGAVNLHYQSNYDENGRFLPPAVLHRRFRKLLGDVPAEETGFYCGSGVTACNNLLALVYAGLGDGRLYAGSWSQWSGDPQNPVAVEE